MTIRSLDFSNYGVGRYSAYSTNGLRGTQKPINFGNDSNSKNSDMTAKTVSYYALVLSFLAGAIALSKGKPQ